MNLNGQEEQNNVSGAAEVNSASAGTESNAGNENKKVKKAKENKPKKSDGPKKPLDKKSLIRIISISAAAVVAAVALTLGLVLGLKGCNNDKVFKVNFEAREHVAYAGDILPELKFGEGSTIEAKNGEMLSFTVSVEEGYTPNPNVTANGVMLTANGSSYSFVVDGDTTVSVAEVFEVSVSLSGSGTSESPYLITSARDINYMASMVNSGSSQYVTGYYRLENDIDCGGQGLAVIGDGSGGASFFGGYFDGNGHTISNYVINARGIDYVGLFGYVQASGSGDELGTITGLNLKNFTMNVYPSDGRNATIGSFIGYGFAANLLVCSAEGGTINIFANNYFCYVGGAIGIQQSATINSGGSLYPFYSAVNYVYTDVNIYRGSGYIYSAGGISGYLFSDHEMATASIANSYATGDIFGAVRAGGIVGILGDYSAIANCYSTGEIEAYSNLGGDTDESNAFAGGIAGYSGVNTIISDSFSTARVGASSANGADRAVADGILAYSIEHLDSQYAALKYNCYSGSNANPTNSSFIKNTLKWTELDWIIKDGALPTINYGTVEQLSFHVNYVYKNGQTVNEKSSDTLNIELSQNYFTPLCDYFRFEQDGLGEVFVSDDDFTSYGYFFDDDLTVRVPYGYVLTREVTFYIGFADYKDVTGAYYYDYNGRTVEVTLNKDGSYVCYDGINFESAYVYDGENLFIYDAPFARFAALKETDEDPSLYFNTYNFVGKKEGGELKLYDGEYFTSENCLTFKADKASADVDEFYGEWEKSATLNKVYKFDGNGSWSYFVNGDETDSGIYTVGENGVATLNNGIEVSVHSSGLLMFKDGGNEEYYCYKDSLFGTWFDRTSGNYIRFEGYGANLSGDVILSMDGTPTTLRYVKDGFFGENAYTLINGDMTLYGYLEIMEDNTLSGVLYSSASGGFTEGHSFCLVDNYTGEWIGENTIDGVDFKDIDFNGFGIYEVEVADGLTDKLGIITIDGERVEYKVDIENGLAGQFEYKGNTYILTFDDVNGKVKIELVGGTGSAVLERKDALYQYTLTDDEYKIYTFNGGGNLAGGGKLTVTQTNGASEEFVYKIISGTVEEKNLEVSLNDGSKIVISNNLFVLQKGSSRKDLEIRNSFTGAWAVSGFMYSFSIGNFDLTNTASGRFMDMDSNATYTYFPDSNYIRLSYISGEMTQPVYMYIIYLEEGNLAVSSYPYLVAGDYYYASVRDELMADTWRNSENQNHIMQFDGLADSKYSQGIAYDSTEDITYFYTRRFGKIYMWEYDNEDNMYYLDTSIPYNKVGANVYNNGARSSFEMVKFDAARQTLLSITQGEHRYDIYLDGSIEIDGKSGTYELVTVNGNKTRLVIHQPGEDDAYAVVDHVANTIVFE